MRVLQYYFVDWIADSISRKEANYETRFDWIRTNCSGRLNSLVASHKNCDRSVRGQVLDETA
jgi:hypothetical protein